MIEFFLLGDFRYFWPENIGNFAHFPSAWDSSLNTGIGQSQVGSLWITSYLNFTALFSNFGLSWNLINLVFWILPAIILSFFSSFSLFNYLFKDKVKYSLLAGIIYTFNTYSLMIITGGQLGVALSYSLSPLVLLTFIRVTRNPTLRNAFTSGLILGFQILFDPRIVYIILLAVFLYLIFSARDFIKIVKSSFFIFITPFVIGILLHSYWILPLILTKTSVLPSGFNSIQGFEFFSFADFSHSLSLLHPNWPENIFGKVYFLKPEFLILPILAFLSLLFVKNKNILFFSFSVLVGAFLSKGSNPPFGEINQWLFQHFPGMVMFRDPTKFYLLIALSYSIVIPYSLSGLASWINSKFKIQNVFLLLFAFYLLFLIRPLWMGEFREKLRPKTVPVEYVQLKDFLSNQSGFSRTLWVPQWQRFGYFSNKHPSIGRKEVLKGSTKQIIDELNKKTTPQKLKDMAVKYVIVPYDSEVEIFLKDREYDEKEYSKTVEELKKIVWLKQSVNFEKIQVFELDGYKDHFWSPQENLRVQYRYVNPTKYILNVRSVKKGDLLVFSESFDKYWTLKSQKSKVKSQNYNSLFNSFRLEKGGDYSLEVYYEPQRWVDIGVVISSITLISVLGFLGFGLKSRKW